MQLRLDALEPHLSKGLAGLYVVYGDEPLLAQEACDKIRAAARAAGAGAAVPNSIAPRLTRAWLGDLQSRRGGPPSRYDRNAFCALLRTGLDPTYVLINVKMPRYRIGERDCTALWRFLNEAPHERR